MLKLRGCPKCQGDLYVEQDMYGAYLSCIQCGQDFFFVDDPSQSGKGPAGVASGEPPDVAEVELAL